MNPDFISSQGRIEVPKSKKKLLLLFAITLVIVIIGLFFILNPKIFAESNSRHTPDLFAIILGLICIGFFGIGLVIFPIQFFSNKPGFIADDNGIYINGSLANFVAWGQIDEFRISYVITTPLIMIYLKNPEQYSNKQTNYIKRKLTLYNYKTFGAPLSITTNSLKCNCDELFSLLTQRLQNFKSQL